MGKNAKRRREAKLHIKLDSQPRDGSFPVPSESEFSLPAVFKTDEHEPITDNLINELVREKGWKEAEIWQFKELGMKYCRERNSFTSPAQSLDG